MKKLAQDKDLQLNVTKHDLIKEHLSKLENGDFKSETSNYLYFYETILKEILGYNLQENILFDEKEEVGRGKSEFVLKNGDKKFMVVELKGSDSDLDKPQNRANDKRTPVDQAFDYAQHTGDIDWILVSNYNEFRLYNWHTKGKYISFTIGELLEKDVFSYFMLCFSKRAYIDTNLIEKLFENTKVVEREIEKEFYKLYNETRLMIIKEFEEINKLSRLDAIHYAQMILNRYMFICFAEDMDLLPDQVSTDTILTPILNGNIRQGSIWQRLNELFLDINEGNEYKDISPYNGGLFKEELEYIEIENDKKLKIRDIVEDQNFFNDAYQNWDFEEYENDIVDQLGPHGKKVNPIYRNLLVISSFDFSSKPDASSPGLDVNTLGHIFENSIGDIEELKADAKGRRKKDGIFYTPDYITDYICKNTIIPYLSKNGAESIPDLILEYSDGDEIEDLEYKVMNIKIVDPACGSGAFLNKASDILLEIHNAIYDFKKEKYTTTIETKGGKGKAKVKRSATHAILDSYFDEAAAREGILVNNIYGVDLNEESVDITKLALFLKVARKDKQLPDIDNNIKWGNSLISGLESKEDILKYSEDINELIIYKSRIKKAKKDEKPHLIEKYDAIKSNINSKINRNLENYFDDLSEIKPFNWEIEFPEIFKAGGFDLVIGNPPYVRQEKIKEIKPYLKDNYEVYTGVADLYVYFFEKGLNVLTDNGRLGFICSNKFIKANYGKNLRRFILENSNFKNYVDHTFGGVFEDATAYPSVFIFKRGRPEIDNKILFDNKFELNQSRLDENTWVFKDPKILDLREKIKSTGIALKDIESIKIHYGIKTGYNKAFIIDEDTKNVLLSKDIKNNDIIKPVLRGKDLKRWRINFNNLYLLFLDWNFKIEDYSSIEEYLSQYKINLEKRSVVAKGTVKWFALSSFGSSYYKKFEKPKLIYPVISSSLFAVYDEDNFYINDKCFIITSDDMDLKFISTLISSNLLNFIFKFLSSSLQGNYYELRKIFIEQIPIFAANFDQQQLFIEKADLMLELNEDFDEEINSFKYWLKYAFGVDKLSKKLEKYYELSLDEFLAELKKKKVDVKNRENFTSLKEEFEKSVSKIRPLLQEIEETDNEIDQMVYELYGLTDDEIKIIEDSLNKNNN